MISCFLQTSPGILDHSSWQIVYSSVTFFGFLARIRFLSSVHRFSIGRGPGFATATPLPWLCSSWATPIPLLLIASGRCHAGRPNSGSGLSFSGFPVRFSGNHLSLWCHQSSAVSQYHLQQSSPIPWCCRHYASQLVLCFGAWRPFLSCATHTLDHCGQRVHLGLNWPKDAIPEFFVFAQMLIRMIASLFCMQTFGPLILQKLLWSYPMIIISEGFCLNSTLLIWKKRCNLSNLFKITEKDIFFEKKCFLSGVCKLLASTVNSIIKSKNNQLYELLLKSQFALDLYTKSQIWAIFGPTCMYMY